MSKKLETAETIARKEFFDLIQSFKNNHGIKEFTVKNLKKTDLKNLSNKLSIFIQNNKKDEDAIKIIPIKYSETDIKFRYIK